MSTLHLQIGDALITSLAEQMVEDRIEHFEEIEMPPTDLVFGHFDELMNELGYLLKDRINERLKELREEHETITN